MSYKKLLSGVEEELKIKAEKDITEYKKDFLEMNIGALTSIMRNAQQILASLEDPTVIFYSS